MGTDCISAVGLKKTYHTKQRNGFFKPKATKRVDAVKGISLTIPRGKITGLLGVNGAGKTTMIRMLAAMVQPTEGALTIDGVDAVKNHMAVKSKINMIAGGERNLFWRLTARENLAYFGALYGLAGKALEEKIASLLALVGLSEAADTPVEQYSKGMKQRLQIARGLINDPSYLFLDEPTLGLDIIVAKEMKSHIAALASGQDKGVLLTTHYISEAEELCDYIYVIDAGTIIAEGTKEELKSLLSFKHELEMTVPTLPAALRQSVEERLAGTGAKLRATPVEGHEDEDCLSIMGDKEAWPRVMGGLMEAGHPILQIHNKEPDLADVLLAIIQDSRAAGQEAI